MKEQEIYIVTKGHPVNKNTADLVVAQLSERAKVLDSDRVYKLSKFCGDEFWKNKVPARDRTFVGVYIFEQVELGNLPLINVPGKHEYPKYYQPITVLEKEADHASH